MSVAESLETPVGSFLTRVCSASQVAVLTAGSSLVRLPLRGVFALVGDPLMILVKMLPSYLTMPSEPEVVSKQGWSH